MAGILANGTAVVTGAGSATGRAIALAFARDGTSNLAIGDLDSTELQETSKQLKEQYPSLNILAESIDINDEGSAARFFQQVVDKFGRIDFAANIAGHEPPVAGAHEVEDADFDLAFERNQRGIFFCSKPILGHMLKQQPLEGHVTRGSIVNVTSIASTAALPGLHVYSATQGGVFGLSKSDAYDYAGDRIRVNVVAPLLFSNKEVYAKLEEHPFKRYATPEDVANAVVFLSGPRAAFISGIALPVDGGFHLKTGGPPR
ncbi:hypothetical protein A1O3_08994 [Capronia epimyces CBS 606.96]|uniref:3-oxoacyl-[acyl-carrier protein] reductase n=1 Tax=Capronia epimyces CBS 606.96 TaxID=1182542 RepID=W9XKK3_9EURO|nr:uncharacterized protein A1O3_08994 [Capronia epimyces CBS 606.96]EXJ77835.1 hypothetical protein A1O3_08994 [Capronia epimyces CBS 606.96]